MFNLVLAFIFGLIIGSFINALVYRLQKGESFLLKRSYCPKCGHKLGFWDLIPILSYLFLRGKCRYCKEKISLQYPLVEFFTGVLFVLTFIKSPFNFYLFFYYLIIFFLIVIFVYDLKYYLIPDIITYSAIFIGIVFNIFKDIKVGNEIFSLNSITLQSLLCGLIVAFLFFILVFLSKEKLMGKGDIGLGFLLGILLGWPNVLVGFFLSFAIGSVIGLVLILFQKKGMKSQIPFGPFLVTGIIITLFWGSQIVDWYLTLFLLY